MENGATSQGLQAFIERHLPLWRARWADDPESWEARCAWQRTLATNGWAAPGWPEEHGGRGLATLEVLAVEEILSERQAPRLPGILGLKNVGPTLLAWGNEEQKRHLPRILSADEIWCQGFSEPDAGSDLASLRTRAVIDGDHFVINGQKTWTSAGTRATHMQLLARTDADAPKHAGISAILVGMATPGITVRPIRQITGEEGFAEVFFSDVRVPVTNVLGPLHDGWRVTMTTLAHERAGIAIFAARLEKRARTALSDYRGRPISAVGRDRLVERYIESRVVGMLGRELLDRTAAGEQPGAEHSIIKLAWSETSQRLDATLAELAGQSLAFGERPDIAHEYLQNRSLTIAAGTTQIVKNLLSERVLGLPRDRAQADR